MDKVVNIICFVTALLYMFVRFKYELQMFQQNSYRNARYLKWLESNSLSFTRILNFLVFLFTYYFITNNFIDSGYVKIIISTLFAILIFVELRKKYKKRLVFTHRAIRLYTTAGFIALFLAMGVFVVTKSVDYTILTIMLLSALSFIVLIIANTLNSPLEWLINRRYYCDAKRILAQNKNIIIIAITGSYGKTSTKHYLHRILSEKYNVLMTPGSYNTTLGVVRTIREQLKPYHEVFIVEMGAKQQGDITEICDLVRPTIGILTSVGEQHLESFKTIAAVQRTKFELIDALPKSGLAVLNADFEHIVSREVDNVDNVQYYSNSNCDVDYYIDDIKYSNLGTNFTIENKSGSQVGLFTKIVGSHNLSNILAAHIVANNLGVDIDAIRYAVSHIEQVEHRLNISKTSAGITIIDDAFNSNPNGAEMALEVLGGFTSGRRIVVTPGLIELGERQFTYNQKFGNQVAKSADYVIVVGLYNREAIMKGLLESSFDKDSIYMASSFADAIIHLNGILTKGDIVLYENDLPDTFK